MARSPQDQAEGPVRISIHCAGAPQAGLPLESVRTQHEFNGIPGARLVIEDGDMASSSLALSDGELFKPGVEVEVHAGYGDAEEPIFRGIVVRHGLEISRNKHPRLIVECRAKACKMSWSRRNAQYVEQTDRDIIQGLIARAGLAASVAATNVRHQALLQYDCSDWDFMVARAGAMGLLVQVQGDEVSVQPPQTDAAAALTVTWGTDLLEFDADIDARTQWAAVQLKTEPARLRGHMSFQGSAKARPGALVTLAGGGRRFSGTVLLTAVEHVIADGNWISRATFGLDPAWQAQHCELRAPPGGGRLPGVGGLQLGVVMQLEGDPAGEHRILVGLPGCLESGEGIWARLLHGYASSGFGSFFVPEVGDEVLVGHLNQDPGHPVVLGSLYSSSRPPPYALSANNGLQAVVTRSRHKVEFNDADQVISVTTPAGNRLVFSDQDKTLVVADQNGNSIKLTAAGIALESPKDISLVAKGGITLDAGKAIGVRAGADLELNGLNIACRAQVSLSAKGAASAELAASGQTTVKGAMVLIN